MFKVRLTTWLLLALSFTQVLPCWSLTLGRRQNAIGNFIAQPNEKLSEDAGPDSAADQSNASTDASKPVDLSPMSLDSNNKPAEGEGSEGNFLKSSVTENNFVPKDQDPQTKGASLNSMSVAEGKKEKHGLLGGFLKKAKDVNAVPVQLMESQQETDSKIDQVENCEKTQIADLWEAALAKSPDIQFVIQKLMPTSDPGHTQTVLLKMISTLVYGGTTAANMMMPSPAAYMGSSMGASMMMQLIGAADAKNAKKAQVSQTESIILYNMVRTTADRMVDVYRNYKKGMISLSRSITNLRDLQAMVSEARTGQDAAKQIEMEYTLRKAQGDVDNSAIDVKHFRQGLIDLTGAEAVAKLDKQLDDEEKAIQVASPVPVDVQQDKVM